MGMDGDRRSFLDFGGPIYSIQRGKIGWRFEMHRVCGPVVVDSKGEPKEPQPREGSGFWEAVSRWAQQGERATREGVCIYD
jgi:hypothetical protein